MNPMLLPISVHEARERRGLVDEVADEVVGNVAEVVPGHDRIGTDRADRCEPLLMASIKSRRGLRKPRAMAMGMSRRSGSIPWTSP